jgi:hypothetical protein
MRAKLVPSACVRISKSSVLDSLPGRRNEEALEAREIFCLPADRKRARRVPKRDGRSVGNDGLSVRRRWTRIANDNRDLAELIVAAVRSGEDPRAADALQGLSGTRRPSGADWARGSTRARGRC